MKATRYQPTVPLKSFSSGRESKTCGTVAGSQAVPKRPLCQFALSPLSRGIGRELPALCESDRGRGIGRKRLGGDHERNDGREHEGQDAGHWAHMMAKTADEPAGRVDGYASLSSRSASRFIPRSRAAAAAAGPSMRRVGRARQLHVAQGRDVLERPQGVRIGGQRARHPRRHRARPARRREHALERPVLAQQVAGGLRADALGARQPVGRVAAQRDEVGNLLGLDAVALAHLGRPDDLRPVLAAAREQHRHAVADALEHVAVAGEQQRVAARA